MASATTAAIYSALTTETATAELDVPLMELQNLTRLYGTVIGVNDLNVILPRGAYGLVGPNGAGKSTLVGLLTGALRPSLGRIRVFGCDPRRHPSVLRRIGLCPASDLLLPKVGARAWLEQMLALSGWPPADARRRTQEMLELVGLAADQDRPIGAYSLGMRQRCKIAQALAHDPELLILDEPFNGLDPIGRHQMIELLKGWAARGRSVLLASHVLHEVEAVTDAFLLIYGGRLLAVGTAGELRGLLADLPQELTICCREAHRLAARLAEQEWIESVRVSESRDTVLVAVREPLRLYAALAEWVAREGLDVTGLRGSDGDLSSLFKLLVSRHQGQPGYRITRP